MNLRQYRTGIMVLAIMLLIQLAMPYFLSIADKKSYYTSILEDDFKFGDSVDKVVLDSFIYHIKKSDGYKIVFIGDSVVAGATVKNRANTIPASFQRIVESAFPGKAVHVYNLGMPGNRQSDIYFTMKKLEQSKAADLIIMNVNYAFFSDEMLAESLIARPDLYGDVMQSESAERLGIKFSSVESFLRNNIAVKWNLYGMREEMSFFLFGMNPREIVTAIHPGSFSLKNINPLLNLPANQDDDPSFSWKDSRPFPADKIEHWVQVFNIGKLDESNTGFWFFEKTAKDISLDGLNAVAFFTPVNSGMIKEYDLMKYGQYYQQNMDLMKHELEKMKVPAFDYTSAVDTDRFHDLFHMGPQGNGQVAAMLFNDLKNTIEKGVGK